MLGVRCWAFTAWLFPFEVSALPGPDEALGEEQDEGENHKQRPHRQAGESDGDGEQKKNLYVEDQKEDRVEVIVGAELNPRIAFGREATFIDGVFLPAGFGGWNVLNQICATRIRASGKIAAMATNNARNA